MTEDPNTRAHRLEREAHDLDITVRVRAFIERIRNGEFSAVRAQSWLDALQCMDENLRRPGAGLLIDDLHRVALKWDDKTARHDLWRYAGLRQKIREALSDTWQLPAARLL